MAAGLFRCLQRAFRFSKDLHTRILCVFSMVLGSLSPNYRGEVLERLAASDVMEDIVRHVVKEGPDKEGQKLELLIILVEDIRCARVMCRSGLVTSWQA